MFMDPGDGVYHSPVNCYRASGWKQVATSTENVRVADDLTIPVCIGTWEKEGKNGSWSPTGISWATRPVRPVRLGRSPLGDAGSIDLAGADEGDGAAFPPALSGRDAEGLFWVSWRKWEGG